MKKTNFLKIAITLIACTTMLFVSCRKKDSDSAKQKNAETKQAKTIAPAEVTGIPFTITYTGLWASPSFEVDDTWESIEIIFDSVPDQNLLQFNICSDSVESEQSWGTAYYTLYPQVEEKNVFNIEQWLTEQTNDAGQTLKDLGASKITAVRIQTKIADELSVKVKSAIVTKKDGTKVAVVPNGDWASVVTED